jgi:hypothetical protein
MNLPTFSRGESQAAYVALTTDALLITADKDLYMKTREYYGVRVMSETKPEELTV